MNDKIPLKFTCLNNEDKNENIFYYEQYSRKLVKITLDSIEIYKKNREKIKTITNIRIPTELILFISIDSNMELISILFEKKIGKNKILFINLTTTEIIKIESNSYDYLLGMFFINNNKNENNKKDYLMIYPHKIIFNSINMSGNIKQISIHNSTKNTLIKDFSYNNKYNLLCCVKTDDTFDFVDLSEQKNYNKFYSKSFSFYQKINIPKSKLTENNPIHYQRVYEGFNSIEKYITTQFFLQNIYKQLYLICLSYLDNKIYILQLISLPNNFNNLKIIEISPPKLSTLQFVDNLLVIHSFMEKMSYIYDISDSKLINKGNIKDFPYHKYLNIKGNYLEEKKDKSRILYNIVFDCEKYFDLNYNSHVNPYYIGEFLFKRNDNKKTMFKLIYNMIIDNQKTVNILKIFNFLKLITSKDNNLVIDDKKTKIITTTEEIGNFCFKLFLDKDLSQNIINNIIFFMSYLKNLWINKVHKNNKNILSYYEEMILIFIKKLENVYEIFNIFDNNYIYYNTDFILQLISKKINFEKFGINLLIKLDAYDEILEYYCKKGDFSKVIGFINEYHNQLKNISLSLQKHKNLIRQNRTSIIKLLK